MFSDEITTTDAFLDMPGGSQLLYFHLGINADDDGFISSPKMIMRAIGASDDELKILYAKKFLLPFPSGVCVVKHWRINNQIRKDRYTETVYTKEKTQLFIRDNGSYSFNSEGALPVPRGHFLASGNQVATVGRPVVAVVEESIVEDSLVKESKDKHGEFQNVLLSEVEKQKLVDQIGANGVDVLITELDQYIASTGKKYKSHYATIQTWARRRINDHVKEIKNKPNVVAF